MNARNTATPRPWNSKASAVYETVYAEDGDLICFASMRPNARANAEFIVRACNSHDDLVKALLSLISYDTYETEYDGRMYHLCPSCSLSEGGEHADECEFSAARRLLIKVTGDERLFDPVPAQPTRYNCNCGRKFDDGHGLIQHRRFSQKCKARAALAKAGDA